MLPVRIASVGDANNITVMPMQQPDLSVAVINNRPDLSQLRDSGFLSNIILEIPGVKRYPVHKNILAISSEYFKALFSGRFKQSDTIVLEQVEPQTVDLYLDMIYGKEHIIYDWRELMKLLVFAKFTQTDILKQDNIIKRLIITPSDFVEYVQELSAFNDGGIPLHIITSLGLYDDFEAINFSDLERSLLEH